MFQMPVIHPYVFITSLGKILSQWHSSGETFHTRPSLYAIIVKCNAYTCTYRRYVLVTTATSRRAFRRCVLLTETFPNGVLLAQPKLRARRKRKPPPHPPSPSPPHSPLPLPSTPSFFPFPQTRVRPFSDKSRAD